jgi:hypothetical protein
MMGRSLCWYVVKLPKEHDKTLPICLDLEFEPEKNDYEIKLQLYQIIHPEITDISYNIKNYKEISELWHSYKYNKKEMWCSKCKFFNNCIDDSDIVIDKLDIQHSYSNPIWTSEWCVRGLWLGSSSTDLMRRFSKEHLYREIKNEDVKRAYKKIEELGDPIRRCDVEAKEETMNVLEFLKKYMDREDVHLIMKDEF